MTKDEIINGIIAVYLERGHKAYGEAVTEMQHGLQCATLAHREGAPPEVIVASLLHDFGHLLHDLGEDIALQGVDARHEHVGANRLSAWFGPEVVEPIRLHAASKRYLCWKEPGYLNGLSEASLRSLELQGGVMSSAEAAEFEAGPHYERAVQVRRYDDRGKDPHMATPGLEAFRPLMASLIRPAA